MTQTRNYWNSENVTQILASIAEGTNYSQAIADKLGKSQSQAHFYIRRLANYNLLTEGEKHGIIQTYQLNYEKLWELMKQMTSSRRGSGPKILTDIDSLIHDNLAEFSAFIKEVIIEYRDETLYVIFNERLFDLLLYIHENKKPTHLRGYGKIKSLDKIIALLLEAHQGHYLTKTKKAYSAIFYST